MKICPNCNCSCSDNDTFCGNCGLKFAPAENGQSNGFNYSNAQNSTYNFAPAAPKNPLAIASLVLGILSPFLLCCYGFGLLPAILAIVFGCVSKSEIEKSAGSQTGYGFGTAGFILGIVTIALAILAIIVIIILAACFHNFINYSGSQNFLPGGSNFIG
jgi:hypothetical protein